MILKVIVYSGFSIACVSCAPKTQNRFSPNPMPSPDTDMRPKASWHSNWTPPETNEPPEIATCRTIWPNAHVRLMRYGRDNQLRCLLVLPPTEKVSLAQVDSCRQALLANDWQPMDSNSSKPQAVPEMYQSAWESFRKGQLTLTFSYAEDGIQLQTHTARK